MTLLSVSLSFAGGIIWKFGFLYLFKFSKSSRHNFPFWMMQAFWARFSEGYMCIYSSEHLLCFLQENYRYLCGDGRYFIFGGSPLPTKINKFIAKVQWTMLKGSFSISQAKVHIDHFFSNEIGHRLTTLASRPKITHNYDVLIKGSKFLVFETCVDYFGFHISRVHIFFVEIKFQRKSELNWRKKRCRKKGWKSK